jgi:hypothetical protein
MSMATVAQVRAASKSTRSARTLLLIIASHVNPDTGWAWPSLATLAQETAVTVQHVIRLIRRLEALGELEVRRGRGRGHVNFYRVREFTAAPNTSGPRKSNISSSRKPNIATPRKSHITPLENVTSRLVERHREREWKRTPVAMSRDKPETHSPFWCPAHGFCHGERLPDHRPNCWVELPHDVEGLQSTSVRLTPHIEAEP